MRKRKLIGLLIGASSTWCYFGCHYIPGSVILGKRPYAYWDSRSDGRLMSFKFEKTGLCTYYLYEVETGNRRLFDFDDLIVPMTWEMPTDDTIIFLGCRYFIEQKSKDTLKLVHDPSGTKKLLFKSVNQDAN